MPVEFDGVGDKDSASATGSSELAAALVDTVGKLQATHEKELRDLREAYEAKIQTLTQEIKALRGVETQDLTQCSLSRTNAFTDDKQSFIEFIVAAVRDSASDEYTQLYHFLLRCFTDADNNFDGRVGFHEFEMLIEAAAFLPRRFGFAPSTGELYASDWDRVKQRLALFKSLSPKKAADHEGNTFEYITFDTWMNYAIRHIREKATVLDRVNRKSQMERSAEEFKNFIQGACKTRKSPEYKELYHFVLKCFTEADHDFDGLISLEDFGYAIDAAVKAPRLFGFAPPDSEMYESKEQKAAARMEIFMSLDKEGTGLVPFDVWLEYLYRHICRKSSTLFSNTPTEMPAIERPGPTNTTPSCPYSSMLGGAS